MAARISDILEESLTLDRLQYAVKQAFTPEILAQVDVESYRDHMFDRMIYDLRAFILAEEVAQESITVEMEQDVSFLFPANPWQHLKWSWSNFVKRHNLAYRGRWLERIYRPRVRMNAHWRTAHKTQVVRTVQFAAFPAATIRTPEKFRGPILVRKEQVDVR